MRTLPSVTKGFGDEFAPFVIFFALLLFLVFCLSCVGDGIWVGGGTGRDEWLNTRIMKIITLITMYKSEGHNRKPRYRPKEEVRGMCECTRWYDWYIWYGRILKGCMKKI